MIYSLETIDPPWGSICWSFGSDMGVPRWSGTSNGWKWSTCDCTEFMFVDPCGYYDHFQQKLQQLRGLHHLFDIIREGTYVNSTCKIVAVSKIYWSSNYMIPSRAKMTAKTNCPTWKNRTHSSPWGTFGTRRWKNWLEKNTCIYLHICIYIYMCVHMAGMWLGCLGIYWLDPHYKPVTSLEAAIFQLAHS